MEILKEIHIAVEWIVVMSLECYQMFFFFNKKNKESPIFVFILTK